MNEFARMGQDIAMQFCQTKTPNNSRSYVLQLQLSETLTCSFWPIKMEPWTVAGDTGDTLVTEWFCPPGLWQELGKMLGRGWDVGCFIIYNVFYISVSLGRRIIICIYCCMLILAAWTRQKPSENLCKIVGLLGCRVLVWIELRLWVPMVSN